MFSLTKKIKNFSLIGLIALSLLGFFTIQAFVNRQSTNIVRKSDLSLDFFKNPFEKKSGIAIIDAVNDGNKDLINEIISKGKEYVNAKDADGNNAMHIIAKKGHYRFPPSEIPLSLIKGGIDVNSKNGEQKTALEISLLSGWQKISYLLLENNADRSVVTNEVVSKITCPDCKRVVKEYKLN